jgi:ankyrin repeat protein
LPKVTKDQLEQRGGSRGSTALHVAAAFGEVEAVQLLLKAGADPNERNDHGENGIQWAWFWGHIATVKALLEGGADPALIEWDPNLGRRTAQKWETGEFF